MRGSERLLHAVLDTNVYVSGTILSHGVAYEILEAWRRNQFILVVSEPIMAEITRVLHYPHIRERYSISEEDITRLVHSLQADALVLPGIFEVAGVSPDPDDDKFLACALEGEADCIVTGDLDLLSLGQYQRIAILRPGEFLDRLTRT